MFLLSSSMTGDQVPVQFSGVWGGGFPGTLTGAVFVSYHAGLTTAGMLSGAVSGWVLMRNSNSSLSSGPTKNRIFGFVFGMVILAFFYLSLGFALIFSGDDIRPFLIWMRGMILGGWITGGAPWFFDIIRQSERFRERKKQK